MSRPEEQTPYRHRSTISSGPTSRQRGFLQLESSGRVIGSRSTARPHGTSGFQRSDSDVHSAALQDLEGQISMDEKLCGIAKQTLEKRTEDAEKKAENAERKTRIADKKAADAEKRAKQIVRDRDAMEEQLTALREKYRTVENVLDEQWDYDVLGQRLAESETRLTESEQRLTNSEKRHTDTRAWAEKQEQVVKTRQQATEAERLKAQHESTAQSERYHSLSSQFRDALFEKKCLEIAQSSAAITQPRLDQDLATARAEIKRLKEKAEKTEVVQQVGLHR
ncbi:hypothetical protein H2199_004010 [Coniosporium tulheliwenetii]|uniref:Uncharacterized protein n=1 Tax=Coniosporium tulheliwenetii TaxID=3383036 RepID=A0ACC2Z8P1_9PEZI|nr:hypothetical protein H2199_004010 [Cladosporium sp. JES 115]